MILINTFEVQRSERELFMTGGLYQEWYRDYPNLFDEDDLRIAITQAKLGYHFYEWLAAIKLYQHTGYLSLVEKYQYKNHKHKQQIIQKIDSPTLNAAILIQGKYGEAQCPDLLVYSSDYSDWYFCEVKGAKDKVREVQGQHFKELEELTGRPVRLMQFNLV